MKITATTHNEYFVETGDMTADLRPISARCFLGGNILRVAYKRGEIVLTPLRVELGPEAFDKVTRLKVGESITF